jgi:hypothetical protein
VQQTGQLDDGKVRLLLARSVDQQRVGVDLQGKGTAIGQARRRLGQAGQRLGDRRVPVRIEGNRAGGGLARSRELGQARRDVSG